VGDSLKQACGYDVILLKQLVITFTTSFHKLVVIGYMVISETRNIHIYQIEHMLKYNTQNILTSHVSYNYFPKKKRPYINKVGRRCTSLDDFAEDHYQRL